MATTASRGSARGPTSTLDTGLIERASGSSTGPSPGRSLHDAPSLASGGERSRTAVSLRLRRAAGDKARTSHMSTLLRLL